MFDIRKIQEQVIYQAVKDKSNEDVAKAIVFGSDEPEKKEDNSMGQSDDGTAGKPVLRIVLVFDARAWRGLVGCHG